MLTFWMSVNVISQVPAIASCSFWAPSNVTTVCCSLLCRNKMKLSHPPRKKNPSCSLMVSPSLGPCPSEERASQLSASCIPLRWAPLWCHNPSGWGDLQGFCLTQCVKHIWRKDLWEDWWWLVLLSALCWSFTCLQCYLRKKWLFSLKMLSSIWLLLKHWGINLLWVEREVEISMG